MVPESAPIYSASGTVLSKEASKIANKGKHHIPDRCAYHIRIRANKTVERKKSWLHERLNG